MSSVGAPSIGAGLGGGGGGGGWRLNLTPTPQLLARVAALRPIRDSAVLDLATETARDPQFRLGRLLSDFRRPLLLGLLLGTIGLLRITIWSQFTPMYSEHYLLVGMTVGLSLVGIVMWGSLCGALLPFLLIYHWGATGDLPVLAR